VKPPHVVFVPLLFVFLGLWMLSWRIYLPLVLVRADHPVIATRTPTYTPTPTRTSTPSRTPSPTVTSATADLRIGYIQYSGGDEYARVDNVGSTVQNMSGWSIQSYDGASCTPLASQIYWFPSGYVLGPGQSVRVHSGPDAISAPPGDLKWTGSAMWNNDGDRGDLRNASGSVVNTYRYGGCR